MTGFANFTFSLLDMVYASIIMSGFTLEGLWPLLYSKGKTFLFQQATVIIKNSVMINIFAVTFLLFL